jgi:cellulose synthase/poly-beta-1,6-N-acetylglucosamine synthase-like glycosyltransferase
MTHLDATIVIAWNGERSDLLGLQLSALACQVGDARFETIVSLNSKVSDEILNELLTRHPKTAFVDASEIRGAGAARNIGANHAKSDKLLFCDADDIVAQNWVSMMLKSLENFDLVGSRLDYSSLNGPSFKRQDKISSTGLRQPSHFKPYAPGCSIAVRQEAFLTVGGFTDAPRFAEDIDFSWRIQQAGYSLGFVSSTFVQYRLDDSFRSAFRRHFKYGLGYAELLEVWKGYVPKIKPADVAVSLQKVVVGCLYLLFAPSRRVNAGFILGHFFGRLFGSFLFRLWAI